MTQDSASDDVWRIQVLWVFWKVQYIYSIINGQCTTFYYMYYLVWSIYVACVVSYVLGFSIQYLQTATSNPTARVANRKPASLNHMSALSLTPVQIGIPLQRKQKCNRRQTTNGTAGTKFRIQTSEHRGVGPLLQYPLTAQDHPAEPLVDSHGPACHTPRCSGSKRSILTNKEAPPPPSLSARFRHRPALGPLARRLLLLLRGVVELCGA